MFSSNMLLGDSAVGMVSNIGNSLETNVTNHISMLI